MLASKRSISKADEDDVAIGDGGYVLMMTALLLIPLMAFTGFAVDLGAWYARATQLQRASEAAALAGVTYMPDVTKATEVAEDVAEANGFPDGGNINVTVEPVGDGRNSLKVTIHDDNVSQYFTSIFTSNVEIERAAVAEYVSPIRMGSPNNYLGNDPIAGNISNYWLVTFGQNSPKGQGDRYHTKNDCAGALIGCSGTNQEYDAEGYYFLATVNGTPSSQPLRFQVYDPLFYDYNNTCAVDWMPSAAAVANASGFYGVNFPYTKSSGAGSDPGFANWRNRFASGNTSWCTGDSDGNHATFPEVETTYIVREPSSDPFDPTAGSIICAVKYGAVTIPGADAAARLTNFQNLLLSTDTNAYDGEILTDVFGTATSNDSLTFQQGWRRWVDLCSVPSGNVEEGSYIVQVRTNVTTNPDVAGDETRKGNQRYALRFGWNAGSNDILGSARVNRVASNGTSTSLGAISRLPVFVNTGGGTTTTQFYMARVTPEYKGKRLVLDIYDTTDGGAVDRLELVPTSDATYNPGSGSTPLTAWPDCEFFRVNGPVSNPTKVNIETGSAAGMARVGGTTCAMSATSGSGNGYAIRIEIDIPTTYDCNDADPFGCWVRMNVNYGTAPTDTTTWSATIDGDPVRLTG